jgi:choline kinase
MKPTLVVLAAGMGSRYGGIKQIEPVGPRKEIILEYSVYDAIRAGFGKVIFVIRRDIERDFVDHVIARFKGAIQTEYVFQDLANLPAGFSVPEGRVKPWGTGHAIFMVKDVIKEPFAVINADDFYGADAFRVIGAHLAATAITAADPAPFCMVGYQLSNTVSDFGSVSRGICEVDGNGILGAVEEHTKIVKREGRIESLLPDGRVVPLKGNETISMNMFGFTPRLFAGIGEQLTEFLRKSGQDLKAEIYIPSIVNAMIQRHQAQLTVLHSSASWFGITYREDLPIVIDSVKALVGQGVYPARLWTK